MDIGRANNFPEGSPLNSAYAADQSVCTSSPSHRVLFLFKNQGHFIQDSKCEYWNKDSTHLYPKEFFIFVWLWSPGKYLKNGIYALFSMNSRKFLWNIEENAVGFPIFTNIFLTFTECVPLTSDAISPIHALISPFILEVT